MDTKERHIIENGSNEVRERIADEQRNMTANSLRAHGRERKRENTRKINRLWLWFGILILIIILLYWLFSIGMFEDITGVANG